MNKIFKKGDTVRALGSVHGHFTKGKLYTVREDYYGYSSVQIEEDDSGRKSNGWHEDCFELVGPGEFIVAIVGRHGPSPSIHPVIHQDRDKADAEAKRLAEKNSGSVYAVYERVGAFVADKPTARAIP